MSENYIPSELLDKIMTTIDDLLTEEGYQTSVPTRLDIEEFDTDTETNPPKSIRKKRRCRNPKYPPHLPKWIDC